MKKIYNIQHSIHIKKVLVFLCSMAILYCFAACGKDKDEDTGGGSGPKASSMSVTIDAEGSPTQVTVNPLDCPITSTAVQDNWLTVEVMTYTSGAPVVVFTATSNPNTSERNTKVIIVGTSQDKVSITVTQKGASSTPSDGGTIEDTHNTVTDQPAYAPQR